VAHTDHMHPKSHLPRSFIEGLRVLVLASSALGGCAALAQEPARPGVQSEMPEVTAKPWQLRRAQFARIVAGVQAGDPNARIQFDAVLTEFETHAFSRTPLENMEIVGVFYLPKEGIEQCLPVIVANDVLGWYDALRFTDESGRSEIFANEGLFKRAMLTSGPANSERAVKFLESNPEKTSQLVAKGIALAKPFRDSRNYDHHWPEVYGLQPVVCASGGPCAMRPMLPEDQWNAAWDEAVRRVVTYYQVNPSEPNR